MKRRRVCLDCPRDISDRGHNAVRCATCQRAYHEAQRKARYERERAARIEAYIAEHGHRYCVDCGENIDELRIGAVHCQPCGLAHKNDLQATYNKRRRLEALKRENVEAVLEKLKVDVGFTRPFAGVVREEITPVERMA